MKIPSGEETGFKISRELWIRIVNYYKQTTEGIIPKSVSPEDHARERIFSGKTQLERLLSLNVPKNTICLDAGCGIGSFIVLALKSGYSFYGYDIDRKAVEIARSLLEHNKLDKSRIKHSKGNIPFHKLKFNLITSFQVAEHVKNLDIYITQLSKKLKINGKIFIETPNYLIPYEPHYYIFLPPVPRKLKWLFFKLYGRSNKIFFNELNFTTPKDFTKTFKNANLKAENLGVREWYKQLVGDNISGRSRYFRIFSSFVKITKIDPVIKYMVRIGFYTPLVYIARK